MSEAAYNRLETRREMQCGLAARLQREASPLIETSDLYTIQTFLKLLEAINEEHNNIIDELCGCELTSVEEILDKAEEFMQAYQKLKISLRRRMEGLSPHSEEKPKSSSSMQAVGRYP